MQDIGFYPEKEDLSSHFVFLTSNESNNKSEKKLRLNLLLVNTYKNPPLFKIYETDNYFDWCHKKEEYDINIRNILYRTQKNEHDMDFKIKLITQYPERLHIHQLKSPDDIFEVDHEDEICEGDEQDH